MLYYRVQIGVSDSRSGRKNGSIRMRPGMTAGIDICTGRKSVLSYLTKPVAKVFRESMNER